MPEHVVPFTFGIDLHRLSQILHDKSGVDEASIKADLLALFAPVVEIQPESGEPVNIRGESYDACIQRWYGGNTHRLGVAVEESLQCLLATIQPPVGCCFELGDVINAIYAHDCWYLQDHDMVDSRYDMPALDLGDELMPFCRINAEQEWRKLEKQQYRCNLSNEGLLMPWLELMRKMRDTQELSVRSLVGMLPRRYYYDFWHSYEYLIPRVLEARIFGLNAETPWCSDCRAAYLAARSPFGPALTHYILRHRWAFRRYLLDNTVFV
jgi:hypothetical protein